MGKIEVYTDGGCKGNGTKDSKGSYGFVILRNKEVIYEESKSFDGVTNNQMELSGPIMALLYLLSKGEMNTEIVLYSDSQYVVRGVNEWSKNWKRNGWKRGFSPIPNADYWKELDNLVSQFSSLTFKWVRGHTNNEWNNYVDALCTSTVNKNLV